MAKTPVTLPNDFFTRFDWDSQDLDVLGNSTTLIQKAAEAVDELGGTVQAQGEAIQAETKAREEADTALGARIDAEEEARKAADSELSASVANEASARREADETLQGNITTVQGNVAQVQTNLDNEVTRATGQEKAIRDELSQDVTSLTSAYEAADATLKAQLEGDIADETASREETDNALSTRVSTLEQNVIWHGHHTFESVPKGATQTYAFQLDMTYASADDIAPYVVTNSPFAYPYVVLVATNALTVGVRNIGDESLTNVIVYAQTAGRVAS